MANFAYGYTRVSHIDSVERGLSLGTQEDTVRERYQRLKAEDQEMEWGGLFTDPAVSAYSRPFAKRPEGAKLNHVLQKGDVVIFPRIDRAFRNGGDFFNMAHNWDERGIRFIFCDHDLDTSTYAGKSFIFFAAIQAHLHSAFISERTKEGLRRKKQLAGHIGQASSIPTGTRTAYSSTLRTRVVIPDRDQKDAALEAARIAREHPDWGDKKISDELEDWLAAKEGRRSFRGIRSRYRYSHRTICKLKRVAAEWERIHENESSEQAAFPI